MIQERQNDLGGLNNQLLRGEEFRIGIRPTTSLTAGEQFSPEVHPPAGSRFSIWRAIPPGYTMDQYPVEVSY